MLVRQTIPITFGSLHQCSHIEGALSVRSNDRLRRITLNSDGKAKVEFQEPAYRQGGFDLRFRINTEEVGSFLPEGEIETDQESIEFWLRIEVIPSEVGRQNVLVCDSPYTSESSYLSKNLMVVSRECGINVNTSFDILTDASRFQTIILTQLALQKLMDSSTNERCREFLSIGGRLVVLASRCLHDEVSWANALTESYGIKLEHRECEDIICRKEHIAAATVLEGINKLWWFRPSPLRVAAPARMLVQQPSSPEEGIAACSGPHDNLYVIGHSSLETFFVSWPFDNGRLFVNLLTR
jgi:hypothetical protein